MIDLETLRKTFHDIQNTLGAATLNIEVVTNPKCTEAMRFEAATDALAELRKLQGEIAALRIMVTPRPEATVAGRPGTQEVEGP